MTENTMPEPVAYRIRHKEHTNDWRYLVNKQTVSPQFWCQEPLYSEAQMRAALATAANDALERAAEVVRNAKTEAEKQAGHTRSATAHDALLMASDLLELAADEIEALKQETTNAE